MRGGVPLKNSIFIFSLLLTAPAFAFWGSQEATPGVGAPSNQCAYNQTTVEPAEAESVKAIRAKLVAAKDQKRALEKDLRGQNCDDCEKVVTKALERVDSDNVDAYLDHLEGGNACFSQSLVSNVSKYNYWASINNWELITNKELGNYSKTRMIAGGDELSGRFNTDDEPVADGGNAPGPVSCRFAKLDGAIDPILCTEAFGSKRSTEKTKCISCLRYNRRPPGKLSRCLTKVAKLEEEIAKLDDEIEELGYDLEEEIDYIKENGDPASRVAKKGSFMSKARTPFGAGIISAGLGLAAGVWNYKKEKKEAAASDYANNEIRKYQGYPVLAATQVSKSSSILLGAAVGLGSNHLLMSSGYFGCATGNGLLGSLTASIGGGNNAGGTVTTNGTVSTGGGSILGSILASLGIGVGNNANSAGGGAVTTNASAYSGLSSAELLAQSQQYANAASDVQLIENVNNTNAAIIANAESQLQVSNSSLGSLRAGTFSNGQYTVNGSANTTTSGVVLPGNLNSVLQGNIQLSGNVGVGTNAVLAPTINTGSTTTQFNPNVPPVLNNTVGTGTTTISPL